MLNAIDEIRQDALDEGRLEGRTEGKIVKLITQTCRKLTKGMQPYEIADIFEEDIEVIENICNIAANDAPEYDVEKIREEYFAMKE